MNLEELKNKFNVLEKKYFNSQEKVKEYYKDIMNNVYDYLDENYDGNVLNYFKNIISGEDLVGLGYGIDPNSLYYWLGDFKVDDVDYEMLKNLSKKTINDIEKNKEQSLDIC